MRRHERKAPSLVVVFAPSRNNDIFSFATSSGQYKALYLFHDPPHNGMIMDNVIEVTPCPITHGLPTRMTKKSFERACRENRHKGNCSSFHQGKREHPVKSTLCLARKTNDKPVELDFVSLREMKKTSGNGAKECSAPAPSR